MGGGGIQVVNGFEDGQEAGEFGARAHRQAARLQSAICETTLEAEVPRRGLGVERAAEVQASSTLSLTTLGN
jgi:hypothetical protein